MAHICWLDFQTTFLNERLEYFKVIINKGTLKTPDLSCGILAGITRNEVIRIALSLGILVKEGHYPSEDLILADEAFITNTTYEVMPVTAIEKNPINDGKVGKITQKLLHEYRKNLNL